MEALESALVRAAAVLDQNGLPYAVIGGLALSRWGVVRATRDVDFKVSVPDTNYGRVRDILEAAFPDPGRPGLPNNPLIVSVRDQGVVIDFLLALPGYEEQIAKRATRLDVGGHPVWFCSAEDLVILKVVAGRPRDWLDVEALLVARLDDLDLAEVERWIGEFAEALERPELVARFAALRHQVERA